MSAGWTVWHVAVVSAWTFATVAWTMTYCRWHDRKDLK